MVGFSVFPRPADSVGSSDPGAAMATSLRPKPTEILVAPGFAAAHRVPILASPEIFELIKPLKPQDKKQIIL